MGTVPDCFQDNKLAAVVERMVDAQRLVRAVLSGRRRNAQPAAERIDLRPVEIQAERWLQVVAQQGRQSSTRNERFDAGTVLALVESGFANVLVETTDETLTLRFTKKGETLLHVVPARREQVLLHDRVKQRLLAADDPFLIAVGISDAQGRVKPTMQDKYLQVEEFLRLLGPTLASAIEAGHVATPDAARPLEVVDLGCGHAYLTFAAHQYLRGLGLSVSVTGVDVRQASRERNEAIARQLGITASMQFQAREIAHYEIERADVVVALHACDTATDDAIAWAVERDVGLLLVAPCCHHDVQRQMAGRGPEPWALLTRHGLMKERLGDLITDALRCQILKLLGYRVEAIEFIGDEHTPRNLMIRAVRTGARTDAEEWARYRSMIEQWHITPALAVRLSSLMEKIAVGVLKGS